MNKRGGLAFGIVIAITLFIIGMTTVNLITPEIERTRVSTALDCTNLSISNGNKLTCLAVDWVLPYWFIIILSAAGGYIFSKLDI